MNFKIKIPSRFQQTLADLERDVISMNESDSLLKKNFLELKEWENVLVKIDQFFRGASSYDRNWAQCLFQGIDDEAIQEIEQTRETEQGIGLKSEKEPIGYSVGVINSKLNSKLHTA